ncbi:hypothetical protein KBTX_02872 [wastewater metagenome]|uniref:Uncharacterized protein n=2 Tax=unclassified sequences TaxID=12908 RepID=A0A5B8RGD3_9ZZZZ|nr:hypothetical protein KBTEX_02872 [uncultured organism]
MVALGAVILKPVHIRSGVIRDQTFHNLQIA